MALKDLSSFLDDDALDIPVDGTTYRIPSPDAETGLWLSSVVNLGVTASAGVEITDADAARLQFDDAEERDLVAIVLGPALDEMKTDGVSWVKIQRISQYALFYFTLGPEAADQAAANGLLTGEAPAPNRAARRQASRGGAATTRARASTAGTTSPRKPARKPKAAR